MKSKRLTVLLLLLLGLCASVSLWFTPTLFAARNIDSSDLTNVRRKNFNYRVECEFDDSGTLLYVRCQRVQQTRSGGMILNKSYTLPAVELSAAELDAAAPQIRNRIESLDALADAKEAATP